MPRSSSATGFIVHRRWFVSRRRMILRLLMRMMMMRIGMLMMVRRRRTASRVVIATAAAAVIRMRMMRMRMMRRHVRHMTGMAAAMMMMMRGVMMVMMWWRRRLWRWFERVWMMVMMMSILVFGTVVRFGHGVARPIQNREDLLLRRYGGPSGRRHARRQHRFGAGRWAQRRRAVAEMRSVRNWHILMAFSN